MTVSSELQATTPTPSVNGAYAQSIRTHKVTVNDRQCGLVHEFIVPEDQYILHTAKDQDISLPNSLAGTFVVFVICLVLENAELSCQQRCGVPVDCNGVLSISGKVKWLRSERAQGKDKKSKMSDCEQ
ncbi:hypothetical protein POM88_024162 [Heracleum sosnowskyi]|uniref:Uncharacterized protein n=1 Tax=Heracleum sosnowskyi TaxID=360622 RepID=A0AAD8MML3_9APIA|nr:hypothetical protein POM88_024162 [Heracleum sosnowskyi]